MEVVFVRDAVKQMTGLETVQRARGVTGVSLALSLSCVCLCTCACMPVCSGAYVQVHICVPLLEYFGWMFPLFCSNNLQFLFLQLFWTHHCWPVHSYFWCYASSSNIAIYLSVEMEQISVWQEMTCFVVLIWYTTVLQLHIIVPLKASPNRKTF